MGKIADSFKDRLARIRDTEGFTAFAKRSGIPQPRLSEWVKQQEPSVQTIERVAAAVGEEPWELIKPVGAKETPSKTDEELLAMIRERDAEITRLKQAKEQGSQSKSPNSSTPPIAQEIISRLSALEKNELGDVLSFIDDLVALRNTQPSSQRVKKS